MTMIRAAILTVSDSCSQGKREDVSGRTIEEMLAESDFEVFWKKIIPDVKKTITDELKRLCDRDDVNVIFTTGGTGLGPHDVTPEATMSVCEKTIPGLSEIIRSEGFKRTKRAVLSRGIAGVRGKTLIVNLPGSTKGAKESLEVILDILPHAVEMMLGGGH